MVRALHHLRLDHPICFIDLETTGVSIPRDRIIEVAAIRFAPGIPATRFTRRLNPGVPIPPAATAIHHITDADVAACPPFSAIALDLSRFIGGADLAGFNILRFDVPLLWTEFMRVGVPFQLTGRRYIDAMVLFHALHPRTLEAAATMYLSSRHQHSHQAAADVTVAAAVLDAMLGAHPSLPRTVEALHQIMVPADIGKRLRLDHDGKLVLNFGKYAGWSLGEVTYHDPHYLRWVLGQDFLPDFKGKVFDALFGLNCDIQDQS